MNVTVEQLKTYLETAAKFGAIFTRLTPFEWDDRAILYVSAAAEADGLLALIAEDLSGDDEGPFGSDPELLQAASDPEVLAKSQELGLDPLTWITIAKMAWEVIKLIRERRKDR